MSIKLVANRKFLKKINRSPEKRYETRQTAEEHRVARDEAGDNTEKLRLIHEPLNKILQERKGHIAKLEELEENEKKRSDEIVVESDMTLQ